jgi:hypothetical protein
MALTKYSNGVSSFGMPVLPGLPPTTGSVFFVDSTTGAAGNGGLSPDNAVSTLDIAIGKCTANKGDIIIVMPGHAETVTATSVAADVAGVRIVGLGTGTLRPTFTYGAAAATITVSAANVSFSNLRFVANFLNVTTAFTVTTAKGFEVTDSEFLDTSSILNFLALVTTNSTANAADGLTFARNLVYGLAASDGPCVVVAGNILRLNISDNVVDKACTNDAAHLVSLAAIAATGARIERNRCTFAALSSQATGTLITGSGTASSGIVADNYVAQIDTTTALIATAGTKLSFIQNFVSGAADKSGTIFPAADDPA